MKYFGGCDVGSTYIRETGIRACGADLVFFFG